jgi:hypothetical protein
MTDVMVPPEPEPVELPEVVLRKPRSEAGVFLACLLGGLYAVSFFLPAMKGLPGYGAFVYALLFLVGIPMWAANPVFWFGLCHLAEGRYRSAGRAGWVALVLALSEWWMFGRDLAVGYYLWAGSMFLMGLAGEWPEADRSPRRLRPVDPEWMTGGEATRIASRFRR